MPRFWKNVAPQDPEVRFSERCDSLRSASVKEVDANRLMYRFPNQSEIRQHLDNKTSLAGDHPQPTLFFINMKLAKALGDSNLSPDGIKNIIILTMNRIFSWDVVGAYKRRLLLDTYFNVLLLFVRLHGQMIVSPFHSDEHISETGIFVME